MLNIQMMLMMVMLLLLVMVTMVMMVVVNVQTKVCQAAKMPTSCTTAIT